MLAGAILMTLSGDFSLSIAAEILMATGMGVANAAVFKLVAQEIPEAVGRRRRVGGRDRRVRGVRHPAAHGGHRAGAGIEGYAHGSWFSSAWRCLPSSRRDPQTETRQGSRARNLTVSSPADFCEDDLLDKQVEVATSGAEMTGLPFLFVSINAPIPSIAPISASSPEAHHSSGGSTHESAPGFFRPPAHPGDFLLRPGMAGLGQGVNSKGVRRLHTIGGGDSTGPDLKGVTGKRPVAWLERVIVEPDKLAADKDPIRLGLMKQYGGEMPNLG